MNPAWRRTNREHPCPICGHHDWCMLATNGSSAICPRIEAGSKKYLDGSGYLHIVDSSVPMQRQADEAGEELPEHNSVLSQISSKMMGVCSDGMVNELASSLGVTRASLRLLSVGWSSMSDAFSFPMFRDGHRLIGIRLRSMVGKKWAIKGSRSGLFVPIAWPSARSGVMICEGPTDTAAMLSLGFNAIGRPSAMGSHAMLAEIVKGRPVCVISDSDDVGLNSSRKVASFLKSCCPQVSVIVPPSKDAREWVKSGATRETVSSAVARALKNDGLLRCQ